MSLVSTSWLEKNLNKVKILDATWNMPNTKRNALEEYTNEHIRNSIFFDIDRFSKKNTDIPHMLPAEEEWAEIVANLGISNQDRIIIYDNSDVISSCRCWYTFIFFGHEPNLVSVLNGGLSKWKREKRKTTNDKTVSIKKNYNVKKNTKFSKVKI